jgi:hypothetical protein
MSHEQLIAKMRNRIELCRRLAASTTDRQAAVILRDMADEGERDLERLEAEERELNLTLRPEPPQG